MTQWPIALGLLVYVFITLLVGLWAGKQVKGASDFIVAGRRLGIWLATGTLAATWFGTGTVLGAAGAAYSHGFLGVIADPFGAALCLFLAGLFYVRVLRRMALTTIAGFFEARFGSEASVVAALCTIPAYVGWVGSLMIGFGKIIHELTGIDPLVGTCIGAAIVIIYTAVGGMWAVTLTDFLQVSVLTLGLVIMAPILIHDMGGWAALRAQIPDDRFYLFPRNADLNVWFGYARDWLVIGLGNLAGQDLIQRSLSSKNESVAQNSAYIAGLLYLTVGMLPVILGIAATLVFPGLEDPERVMMHLARTYLPPVGIAVFLGALVSALMSSADSALLAPASVIGWDIVKYLRPETDEQQILRICRWCVPVLGLIALMLALTRTSVYSLMVDSWSVLLATLFVPLTAGIWWSRANNWGALSGMCAGGVSWLLLMNMTSGLPADLLAVPFALAATVAVSLATGKVCPPRPLLDRDGRAIPALDRLGIPHPKKT